MAGQATLIKASITSIPAYAMQTMLLPQKICHRIDKLSCNFLWGDTEHHRGCHSVNWATVTTLKAAGGLGIPSTRHRNHAILMNQAWHLYSNPTTLWARVLQAKYFSYATLFTSPHTSRGSHIWTAFSMGIKLLREGMTWIVGDGQTIRIWQDPWLPNGSLRSYIAGPLLLHDEENRVHSLWINQSWAFDLLNFPLSPHLQNLIQGIPIAHTTHFPDAYLWPYNKGMCSVKSASHFLYDQSLVPWNTTLWNWLWTLPCPKKIQFFLWKAMRNRLPTRTFLAHGQQHVDSHCPRCNSPETTLHILRDCPWAREVWS